MVAETSSCIQPVAVLASVFRRFWLPLLVGVLGNCFAWGFSAIKAPSALEVLCFWKIFGLTALASFWFVALRLYAEARGGGFLKTFLLGFLFFVLFAGLLFVLPAQAMFFAIPGFFLTPFCASLSAPDISQAQGAAFRGALLRQLGWALLFTAILKGILFLLIGACLCVAESSDFLVWIATWIWLLMGLFLLPFLWLCGIPDSFQEAPRPPSRAVSAFLGYGLVPLFLVHTLLLLACFIKRMFFYPLWDPYLVTASGLLLMVGIPFSFLASPQRAQHVPILAHVPRGFLMISPFLLIVLAMGLVAKTWQEGIAEPDFAGYLLLMWGTILTVAGWAGKDLTPLALRGAVVLLLLGSLIVEPLSTWSQERQLYALLEERGMLMDGRLQRPPGPLRDDERFRELVSYFYHTRKIWTLKRLLAEELPKEGFPTGELGRRWVLRQFGLSP